MKSSSRRPSLRRTLENRSRRKSFLKGVQRRLHAEQLETRVLLAGDILHNFDDPYDTDRDGVFAPVDILHVINQINEPDSAVASGESPANGTVTFYNDVNGDGFVSPIDALHTINEYNTRSAEGAGEPLVRLRVQAVALDKDINGLDVPLTSITKGTDYYLKVLVQDLRIGAPPAGSPNGVYAAYLDLLYPKALTNVEIEEIQEIRFGNNPGSGNFTLSFDTDGAGPLAPVTTDPITFSLAGSNPDLTIAANIQAKLDSKFGAHNFLVTPVSPGDANRYYVRFMGKFGDQDVVPMTGNVSNLVPQFPPGSVTIQVLETVAGVYSANSFREAFRFSPQYDNPAGGANDGQAANAFGHVADPNRLDEAGNFAVGTATLGPAVRELFRVRMNTLDATAVGQTVVFDGSVDNIIRPSDDTLIYSGGVNQDGSPSRDVVNPPEIEIIDSVGFTITEPFSAVANTFTFAETSSPAAQALNVKANDLPNPLPAAVSITRINGGTSPINLSIGTVSLASGNISFTPLANINGSATFTYTLTNSSTGVTDTATVTINVTAVNNAPTNTVPGAQTTNEDTAKVINGISITDIDANETAGATVDVDLSVQHGTITLLTIPSSPSFEFRSGGNGASGMVIRGSVADINAALNGLSYHPAPDYFGLDSLRMVTNDRGFTGSGGEKTATSTVSITVDSVNDAPTVTVPSADPGPVLEEETITITGTTVNDVDALSGIEKVTLSVSGGNGGLLKLNSTAGITFVDGTANNQSSLAFTGTLASLQAALASFDYTPQRGDAPSQTITLNINDQGNTGSGGSLVSGGIINVEVTPLSLPFARKDSFTVNEDSSGNVLPVLANDLVDTITTNNPVLVSVNQPDFGTTSLGTGADLGKVIYAPPADFWGVATFTYVMFEDNPPPGAPVEVPSTGTVTVTITNINDAPVAVDDSLNVNEDTTVDIDVVVNDTDKDNNNNAGPAGAALLTTLTPTIVGLPANGTASVVNGKIRYRGNQDFFGSDTIRYTVNDGSGTGTATSNTATVSITIDPVNDAPVALPGTLTTAEDTPTTGILAATDVDSASLTYTLVSTTNAHGTVLITNPSTGAYSYTPDLDYNFTANGPASFTFKANDGSLDSNTATVAITVTAVNDPPVANPDSYLVENQTLLNANVATAGNPRSTVRANDSDVDNALTSLTVSLEAGMGPSQATSFTLNADGSFQYTAPGTFVGIDTFVYRLTDSSGGFSTATVTIDVREKNDPPVAVNDAYDITEDIQRDVNTATGVRDGAGLDSDPDTLSPNSSLTVLLLTPPAHDAVFNLNTDGSFSYKADANYNGPDSFTYQLRDGFGALSNTATVSLNVLEVNDNPTANDDGSPSNRLTLIKNTAANPFINQEIDVLANDNDDPDFNVVENLTIISAGGAGGATLHGTVTISQDGKKLFYTPNEDYESAIDGPEQFTYTISDGRPFLGGGTGTATATVYIEVVNFIPTDITGTVFTDTNNNGVMDGSEKPLAGVKVTLEGHDTIFNLDFGADTDNNASNDVAALVVYTDINGNYRFDAPGSLRPGMRPGSYTITEEQPSFMRDGLDSAGNNAELVHDQFGDLVNDKIKMTLPLLGIAGGIHGNNFAERGLDPAAVSISDILSSSSGDGLIMAINGSTPLWYTRLSGWTNLKSCSVVLSSDTSTATFTFTDMQNNVYHKTISQVGNPRFRIMGRIGSDELIRLDGTAADFGLNLLAAQGPQPEGEADDAGYARSVDELMAAVGNA